MCHIRKYNILHVYTYCIDAFNNYIYVSMYDFVFLALLSRPVISATLVYIFSLFYIQCSLSCQNLHLCQS